MNEVNVQVHGTIKGLVHYECPKGHSGIFTKKVLLLKPTCNVCGARMIENEGTKMKTTKKADRTRHYIIIFATIAALGLAMLVSIATALSYTNSLLCVALILVTAVYRWFATVDEELLE